MEQYHRDITILEKASLMLVMVTDSNEVWKAGRHTVGDQLLQKHLILKRQRQMCLVMVKQKTVTEGQRPKALHSQRK